MIQGKKKTDLLDVDEIMMLTNGGFDIFRYYLGATCGRIMQRPWMGSKKEKTLSWGIFCKGYTGIWCYSDRATEDSGNAIHFVQKYFGLTFPEAINKICWDFGLGGYKTISKPAEITWEKPDIEKDYTEIGVINKPFTQRHKDYWSIVGCSEEHCNEYNCFAVKNLAINRRNVPINPNEIVFSYYNPVDHSYKIYFPDRPKDKRFKNNVRGHYIWYLDRYNDCDDLMIAKSNKDAIVLAQFGLCVAATQNEGISCIEPNIEEIQSRTKKIHIVYGNDKQGWDMSYKITKKYGWDYFNIPQPELEKGIIDPYDYAKAYGPKKLEELLKLKNLI